MSVVDLAKARAFADVVAGSMDPAQHAETAADWICELADEVASLQRALLKERQDYAALVTENADLHTGLERVLQQVVALLALTGGKP